MPVIHALHCVLVGLFVVTNLVLIPIAAMFGAALGSIAADQFNVVGTGASLMLVAGGFMGVGIINGSLTIAFLTLSEIQKNNRILAGLEDLANRDAPVEQAPVRAAAKKPRRHAAQTAQRPAPKKQTRPARQRKPNRPGKSHVDHTTVSEARQMKPIRPADQPN